ncbi:MAG: hypothetical protein R6W67_12420 [Bacteroidales bacterium]
MRYLSIALMLTLSVSANGQQGRIISNYQGRSDFAADPFGRTGVTQITKAVTPGLSSFAYSTAGEGSHKEQTWHGTGGQVNMVTSFEGLGYGFDGTHGSVLNRNPSDNSLAVSHDYIVQIVNTHMAIFTKEGSLFRESGIPLYGPVETRNVFRGFGGPCEEINNGDAVVRYDQLADRWLIVMPIFRRVPFKENEPPAGQSGDPAKLSMPGIPGQPGKAEPLHIPRRLTPEEKAIADSIRRAGRTPAPAEGSYCMCYAVSAGPDPFGPYYRYEFRRPLFPDYPRPAVWTDGYYVPTSTGDHIIQKHACIAERNEMLKGNPARELCFIIDGVNFLNNADIDGFQLPPDGEPNIMLATGGSQLNGITSDNGIYIWKIKPDWNEPENSLLEGPQKVEVAEYHYQGGGQLIGYVPQPGTTRKLDTQGDKLMSRVVYRKIGDRESIVAVHSVTPVSTGTGGIRWYEFRVGEDRRVNLFQQGTFAPDTLYRFLPSPAMDKYGNIGIGYTVGGEAVYPGQRFAGRLNSDPKGVLNLREAVLVDGEDSQTNTLRWEDYSQTAVDPSDDMTIWYVGDYFKKGAPAYSTRIGAFRLIGTDGRK